MSEASYTCEKSTFQQDAFGKQSCCSNFSGFYQSSF
ncbi:MAG: hypothetical protein ACI83I_002673, partial [Bacteroidia bacterium]